MKGVAVGEHEGSSRSSSPRARGGDREGRENREVETDEMQSGTHVPELMERLARLDPMELARLLKRVRHLRR